jgi:hypothetical protein
MIHDGDWVVGRDFAEEDPGAPTHADPDRKCDFCGIPPTTHWLTFDPAAKNSGYTLSNYLGACAPCADSLDFRDRKQLARESELHKDEAKLIARHFRNLTKGL